MTKISIRFYNDREMRAVWNKAKSKWRFEIVFGDDIYKEVVKKL